MKTIGVISSSHKENEKRVPIHPDHLPSLPEPIRKNLFFEKGYGEPFGVEDTEMESLVGGILERHEVFEKDIVLLPKPVESDLRLIKEGGILWGWPHCVQQEEITQIAIDRRLTLIAWEAMHRWRAEGKQGQHIFYKNNELAGYCGVLDALRLMGMDGYYGPVLKIIVLSFGAVSYGAVRALQGRGFTDITVFTQRAPETVDHKFPGVIYRQMKADGQGCSQVVLEEGHTQPMSKEIATADIIVNGILQDPNHPLMYMKENDSLKPRSLIIDISGDKKMGFPFARTTSFEAPIFKVGSATYYAVDHTPTYLWNSASWEISNALIPFIEDVMKGPATWESNETIRRSLEIKEGIIQNPTIISYQKRTSKYPYEKILSTT